jgi:hypothetical protein
LYNDYKESSKTLIKYFYCEDKQMMSGQVTAEIGHWYRALNDDQLFEVVAIDYDEQTIETQNFDGDISQIEFTGWKGLFPIEIAPPEDWTGPYEIDRDDTAFNSYVLNEAILQYKSSH